MGTNRISMEEGIADVREAIASVPGEISESTCGCEWKRVKPRTFCYHGCWVSGDVLTRQCTYHEWYGRQPIEVQREVSRQERARWRGMEDRA
jgi:hypothetical protein